MDASVSRPSFLVMTGGEFPFLLFFLLFGSLGWCLMVVEGTRSLDLLFAEPFFLKELGDLFETLRVVMVTFTLTCGSLSLLRHFPHTSLLAMGLNVAKCNLGAVKQETMLSHVLPC